MSRGSTGLFILLVIDEVDNLYPVKLGFALLFTTLTLSIPLRSFGLPGSSFLIPFFCRNWPRCTPGEGLPGRGGRPVLIVFTPMLALSAVFSYYCFIAATLLEAVVRVRSIYLFSSRADCLLPYFIRGSLDLYLYENSGGDWRPQDLTTLRLISLLERLGPLCELTELVEN